MRRILYISLFEIMIQEEFLTEFTRECQLRDPIIKQTEISNAIQEKKEMMTRNQ